MGTVVILSSLGFSMESQHQVGSFRHVEALHAVPVAAVLVVAEDGAQSVKALLGVIAEVVRVPPKVVSLSSPGCPFHFTADAIDFHAVEEQFGGAVRTQEAACGKAEWKFLVIGNILHAVCVLPADGKVRIEAAVEAFPHRFIFR